ncbi:MAG TPA: SIS domain-containing protein [Candidatus Aerophobetes bacterium]|uniref:SIS domain-containing protein n=1 Tax=Aerophobetes bacterium TaxID=2030807 RepID=A0A7V5LZ95_UNCAE|nr:SIS domain-containing protein [Candidatus Aerophobetes bacterium]
MDFQSLQNKVCQEINSALSKVEKTEIDEFINTLLSAEKVFVMAVGRVMLMLQAFAKRIKHLGIDSYVVGETVVPPISHKDVLVVGSGSGETASCITITQLARKFGAKIALITSSKNSTLKKMADISVRIPSPTKLKAPDEPFSIQPMSNLFEQALLIFCDCISMILQEKLGITEEKMWKAHANLE